MEVNRVNLSISTGLLHRQVSTGQRSANGLKDLNLKLADVEKIGALALARAHCDALRLSFVHTSR